MAQTTEPSWQTHIGSKLHDEGRAVVFEPSGGLALAGETNPEGPSKRDVLLVVFDHKRRLKVEKPIVLPEDDGAHDIATARDGGYYIVGFTYSPMPGAHAGSRDGLVMKVNEYGRPLWLRALGTNADDILYGVTEAPDGSVLVCGQRNEALMVANLTTQGELRWEQTYLPGERAAANDLAVDAGGNIFATGYVQIGKYDYELALVSISPTGTQRWAERYPNAVGEALLPTPDGGLLVAGVDLADPAQRENALLLKTSGRGTEIWRRSYGGGGSDAAFDLRATPDGGYLLYGYNRSFERAAKRSLAWVQAVDAEGEATVDERLYGRNSEDRFHAGATGFDGVQYAVGTSASGKRLMRDVWLVAVTNDTTDTGELGSAATLAPAEFWEANQNGVIEIDERGYQALTLRNTDAHPLEQLEIYITTPKGERHAGVHQLPVVRLPRLAAGAEQTVYVPLVGLAAIQNEELTYQATLSANGTARTLATTSFTVPCRRRAEPRFELAESVFLVDGAPATGVNRNQEFELRITVTNVGNRAAENVEVRLNTERFVSILDESVQRLDSLGSGQRRTFSCRFVADRVYVGELAEIKLTVTEKGHRFEYARTLALPVTAERYADITPLPSATTIPPVTEVKPTRPMVRIKPPEPITPKPSTRPADPVATDTRVDPFPVSDPVVRIKSPEPIAPKPSTQPVDPVATDTQIDPLTVADPVVRIKPLEPIVPKPTMDPAPTLEPVKSVDLLVTDEPTIRIDPPQPLPEPVPVPEVNLELIWLDPDPVELGERAVTLKDSEYRFKLRAYSDVLIDSSHFTILLDGEPIANGAKFDHISLSAGMARMRDGTQQQQLAYTFKGNIIVPSGKHTLAVQRATDGVTIRSEVVRLDYPLYKPNLFVLSIGVPYNDLRFTKDDAADFADAYNRQAGTSMMFGEVKSIILNTKEATTKRKIESAIYSLSEQYVRGKIRENDLIMLHISSHGFSSEYLDSGNEQFYIQPSDYLIEEHLISSINYKDEILKPLERIRAKKLILIDACHSGSIAYYDGAKGGGSALPDDVTGAIIRINRDNQNVRSIVSCRQDERSYEDPKWANGAFTEALMDAFANRVAMTVEGQKRANANSDRFLTVKELCYFLRVRVPQLVQDVKGPGVGQNPHIDTRYLTDDLPIYQY